MLRKKHIFVLVSIQFNEMAKRLPFNVIFATGKKMGKKVGTNKSKSEIYEVEKIENNEKSARDQSYLNRDKMDNE